jgi:DNA invertase Pin-like site-specific DNA recombinase
MQHLKYKANGERTMKYTISKKIVAYYRLSRPKKGKTKDETKQEAYGIAFQKAEVKRLAEERGATIIAEYSEIESGRGHKRTEILKAIEHAKRARATLVIAKLERLARNVHFITGLQESKVDFVCCDMPSANKLTIQMMAVVAEEYADSTSVRIKDTMAIAKSRGVKLGSSRPGHWKGREHLRGFKKATKISAKVRHENAVSAYRFLVDDIRKLRKEGKSFEEIATYLNDLGHTTTRGNPFRKDAVFKVLKLFEKVPA